MKNPSGLNGLAMLTTVALLFVITACNPNPHGDHWRFISGTVIDASTSRPVDSAWAALRDTVLAGSKWYTDSLGNFRLPMSGSAYGVILFVGKDGYATIVDTFPYVADTSGLRYELVHASPQ